MRLQGRAPSTLGDSHDASSIQPSELIEALTVDRPHALTSFPFLCKKLGFQTTPPRAPTLITAYSAKFFLQARSQQSGGAGRGGADLFFRSGKGAYLNGLFKSRGAVTASIPPHTTRTRIRTLLSLCRRGGNGRCKTDVSHHSAQKFYFFMVFLPFASTRSRTLASPRLVASPFFILFL